MVGSPTVSKMRKTHVLIYSNKGEGMHAIWIEQPGGPEVLSYQEGAQPKPGSGEALVKVSAI